MMEAVRTSETSVDNQFTRHYNPEDSSEHHTRRRENLKSQLCLYFYLTFINKSLWFLFVCMWGKSVSKASDYRLDGGGSIPSIGKGVFN
jgi:hypothetical protein